jgi:hypothetical protein
MPLESKQIFWWDRHPTRVPTRPRVLRILFHDHHFHSRHHYMLTGTVQLSPVVATDYDLHRSVTITVNGVALPVIDAVSGPATFSCNPGDLITAVATDINAVGASPASAVFSVTAAGTPTAVPATPSVVGVNFV